MSFVKLPKIKLIFVIADTVDQASLEDETK